MNKNRIGSIVHITSKLFKSEMWDGLSTCTKNVFRSMYEQKQTFEVEHVKKSINGEYIYLLWNAKYGHIHMPYKYTRRIGVTWQSLKNQSQNIKAN